MIEQLKNFIRQGKQANKPDNNDGNNERYPVTPSPIDNVRSYVEIKTRDNSSAIQQLVAEEREQRKKMRFGTISNIRENGRVREIQNSFEN